MKRLVLFAFIIAVLFGLYKWLDTTEPVTAMPAPTPAPAYSADLGIRLTPAIVRSALGTEKSVHIGLSPDYSASKTVVNERGDVEILMPADYSKNPFLTSLTVGEAQEYVLRQLMANPGDVVIDTNAITLDTAVLTDMATSDVQRADMSSLMKDYSYQQLAKDALDVQSKDHQYALQTVKEVAQSGDQAEVGIVAALAAGNATEELFKFGTVLVVAVAVLILFFKSKR